MVRPLRNHKWKNPASASVPNNDKSKKKKPKKKKKKTKHSKANSMPYNVQPLTKSAKLRKAQSKRDTKDHEKEQRRMKIFPKRRGGNAKSASSSSSYSMFSKQRSFSLPTDVLDIQQVPWMQHADASHECTVRSSSESPFGFDTHTYRDRNRDRDRDNTKPNNAFIPILPKEWYTLPHGITSQFQMELVSFAEYVSLSSLEVQVRQSIIHEIESMCQDAFRTSREDIRIQPFGSFATLEVCTFASDVDLALWGAVPTDTDQEVVHFEIPNKKKSGKHKGGTQSMAKNKVVEENEEGHGDGSNVESKQDKIHKWRLALEASNTVVLDDNSEEKKQEEHDTETTNDHAPTQKQTKKDHSSKTCSSIQDTGKKNNQDMNPESSHQVVKNQLDMEQNTNQGNDFLFVIDREGVKEFGGDNKDEEVNLGDPERKHTNIEDEEVQCGEKKLSRNKLKDSQATSLSSQSTTTVCGLQEGRNDSNTQQRVAKQEMMVDHMDGAIHRSIHLIDGDGVVHCPLEEETKPESIEQTQNVESVQQKKLGELLDEALTRRETKLFSEPVAEKGTSNQTLLKKRPREVITIDDSDELSDAEVNDSDSDDDSADKMERFFGSTIQGQHRVSARKEQKHLIDLCSSSSTSSDDDSFDQSEKDTTTDSFEVSCVFKETAVSRAPPASTGKVRKKVVQALVLLGKRLRNSSFTQHVHVRTKARVPIICTTTRMGFDGDIALGGHNGTDTSHYVRAQVERFKSFSTVVLLLKILLQQTDLDKPFTGGLGSYKLYVMVAHHYEQHLAIGGVDTPAEMLMSFLFRYGGVDTGRNQMTEASTRLYRSTTLQCDGGEADFQPVNQLESCVKLFGTCYGRLMNQMKEKSNEDESKSLIGSIVSPHRLQEERQRCMDKASGSHHSWGKRNKDAKSVCHTGKSSYEKKPFTFTKEKVFNGSNPFTSKKEKIFGKKGNSQKRTFSEMAKDRIMYALRSKGNCNIPSEPDVDDLDRVLVTKKNKAVPVSKRSKRGALIPKERPDLDAKRAQSHSEKILTRGRKKRKNKKKQKRDEALTEFAMENT